MYKHTPLHFTFALISSDANRHIRKTTYFIFGKQHILYSDTKLYYIFTFVFLGITFLPLPKYDAFPNPLLI